MLGAVPEQPSAAEVTAAVGRTRPRHAVRRVLHRTLTGAWNDDIFSESAAAAFWQTLSLPPLLLGLFGLLGYTNGVAGTDTAREVEVWALGLARGVFSRPAMEEIATLYYPVIGGVLLLALTTMYLVALPLKPPWHRGLPGAALAVLAFFGASSVLRVYLDSLSAVGFTYGALAAPIAFLLVTFAIGLAVILGAHLNAAIQSLWPAPLRDRRRRLERQGPGTPALRRMVAEDPEAAAAVLARLGHDVRPPAPRPVSPSTGGSPPGAGRPR